MALVPFANQRQRVLVVEDHADSRDALVFALERVGYDVATAADGGDAFDRLQSDPPDLVVLDLMLPQVTGWELLRLIRQHADLASIPIVVVSAYYTPHQELGPVRFVPKPASIETILRAIRESVRPPPIPDAAVPTVNVPRPPRSPDVAAFVGEDRQTPNRQEDPSRPGSSGRKDPA